MDRRAASICRFVIQQASSACRANWPKATVLPRVATPVRRPLCCLRCFTRLGRSIASLLTFARLRIGWGGRRGRSLRRRRWRGGGPGGGGGGGRGRGGGGAP